MLLLKTGFSLIVAFIISVGLIPVGAQSVVSEKLRFSQLNRISYDREKHLFILILKDSWVLIPADSIRNGTLPSHLIREARLPGIGAFAAGHEPYLSGDELLFTTPGTGMVYRAETDRISRIDHSFDHQAQVGAIEFIRHDTIWRHGGYGTWSAKNLITYFDKAGGEWQVLRPFTGDVPPPGLWGHYSFRDGDSLWIFGGKTIQKADPEAGVRNPYVWLFSFHDRSWRIAGSLSGQLPELERANHVLTRIGSGKALFIESGHLRILDFRNNMAQFRRERVAAVNYPQWDILAATETHLHYFKCLNIHDITRLQPDGYDAELVSVPLNDYLNSKTIRTVEIFESGSSWKNGPIIFLVFLLSFIGIIGFLFYRKRAGHHVRVPTQRLMVEDQGIRIGGAFHPFEPEQILLIRLLLNAEKEVQTGDIVDLMQNPEMDYSHKLRMKNQLIEGTNVRLRAILKISGDPIRITRSRNDRRIRIYSIDKGLFS